MKKPEVAPRAFPREFRADEMFFSTTDARGVITAGNDVFARVSGYDAGTLVGRAHNIIRHPDMPRAAFRLVWAYLKQSRRTAAMVKNLARDGCFYWVVALFAPVPGGFVSIRFKPTSPLVDEIAEIYAAMRAEEERQLERGATEEVAMDAAAALLGEGVRARGFADYDAFMRAMLCDELKSRDAVLARVGASILRPLPAETDADAAAGRGSGQLRSLYRQGATAYAQLSRLFLRLDDFVALQQSLEGKASFVDNLTRELRVAAMNAALAATRVGSQGQSLSVVSHYMGSASVDVAGAVKALTSGIRAVADQLRSVIFNLAAGRLQIEMIMAFMHELISEGAKRGRRPDAPRAIRTLQHAFQHSLERASGALRALESSTRELQPTACSLGRHMLELQVAQLCGVVETTRLDEHEEFAAVFTHIRELVDGTRRQLGELDEALDRLDDIAIETPETAREIASSAARMDGEIAALAVEA